MIAPTRTPPLQGGAAADFRSSQDVEEYLVHVARVNRGDTVGTGRRGGVPLSSGEIERLRREDFEKRRKLRLIQVREQAKTIAIARRQNFIEDIDRKRAQEKERRRKAWEAQQHQKIKACTQQYKQSLAAIGVAHLEAQQHATRLAAEKARKSAVRARARLKEDKRHKAALRTQRQEKAEQPFFVRQALSNHRLHVRNDVSDAQRTKAHRMARALERARQKDLASQAAAEAAQAAARRSRDRVIDISAQVPNTATRLQDFATTRFHASLTKHAQAAAPATSGPDAASGASADLVDADAFEAAEALNHDMQEHKEARVQDEERRAHAALERGREAAQVVRATRDQDALQSSLEALRKEEIFSHSRQVVQKIRHSWQKRAALDKHKLELQQRLFEQNFVQTPQTHAHETSPADALPHRAPEVLHIIPETAELDQHLLQPQQSPSTPPSPEGADEGERLVHHDVGPAAATTQRSAEQRQKAQQPAETRRRPDRDHSVPIAIPTVSVPAEAADRGKRDGAAVSDADNDSDDADEIDADTRALLDASRDARLRGNQSVQAILRMGQSFLDGSTNYTTSSSANAITAPSSSSSSSSPSVSSTDLSLHARAAAAASAAARAAAEAAAQHARNQTSSFPTREQLEQSLTHFLLGAESDDEDETSDGLHAAAVAGLSASFVSSTSSVASARSWEPRRAPGERPGALNDLAMSVLRDLEARPARPAAQAPFSVASSEVSSLRQYPLSPSSRPSTANELGQSRASLAADDLIVHDEAWKGSTAFANWVHQVETALANEDQDDTPRTPPTAPSPPPERLAHTDDGNNTDSGDELDAGAKSPTPHLASPPASAAGTPRPAAAEDLIVEDEGWKTDDRFASFTADLAQYFEASNTPQSTARSASRRASWQSDKEEDARLSGAAFQSPTLEDKFEALEARLRSANRAARPSSSNATPPPPTASAAASAAPTPLLTPQTRGLSERNPPTPSTEAKVDRALRSPTMESRFTELEARLRSAVRAAQPRNSERNPELDDMDASILVFQSPSRRDQAPSSGKTSHPPAPSPPRSEPASAPSSRPASPVAAGSPIAAAMDSSTASLDNSAPPTPPQRQSSASPPASPAQAQSGLMVSIDSSPSAATAAQSSKSSLDSLEQIQRALQTAREELRAAAALRESPTELTFGSLVDPSSDINLGLSQLTSPNLEASPPRDDRDDASESAVAFHMELFGDSISEELDREASVPVSRAPEVEDVAPQPAAAPLRLQEAAEPESVETLHESSQAAAPERPSPKAFTIDLASEADDGELLVKMPRSPTRADLERARRAAEPPTPDLLRTENESDSGAMAFAVEMTSSSASLGAAEARSRAFQERSARRAAEAQQRAQQRDAAAQQRQNRPTSPRSGIEGSSGNTGAAAAAGGGPTRASFGQRAPVDPREQRARSARLFRKLPEVRQREEEQAQRREAEERRRRVRQMEEGRRKALFRKKLPR